LFDDERLAEFFEKGLPKDQQERLMEMTGDEMHRELVRLYMRKYMPQVNFIDMRPRPQDGPDNVRQRGDRRPPSDIFPPSLLELLFPDPENDR
jgi:hypothetical protein